jgi:hypothetical protein
MAHSSCLCVRHHKIKHIELYIAMTPNKNNDDNTTTNEPTIPPELSKKLLQMYKPDGSKRIPNETAKALSEVLRIFVVEATSRASIEVS